MKNVLNTGSLGKKKLKQKTIITAALTGAGGAKANNPNTPITPEEIAADAIACAKAGAAIVHLHMKADDGVSPSMDVEKFRRAQELIRAESDVIINMTTSGEQNQMGDIVVQGSLLADDPVRNGVLTLKPEIATLDIPTINFGKAIFVNSIPFITDLAEKMANQGVKPEIEIFDIGDIEQVKTLMKEGILNGNLHFQFCLGIRGGAPADPAMLVEMVRRLPEGDHTWSCFGVSTGHLPIMYTALALDGNIRVGLEDNLYYERGVLATNVSLVERAVKAVELYGNEVATPAEAREILGL